METDDDSHSSSNTSGSSASSSNGPASPPQEPENESNDQPEVVSVQRSPSSSPDSNSFQDKPDANQSSSPVAEQKVSNEHRKDDEDELELSDMDDESSKPKKAEISHEDLSDISDLESNSPSPNFTDLREKLDKQRLNGSSANEGNKSNDEDELDFEADEVRDVSENPKKVVVEPKEPVEKAPREEGETKSDDGSLESGEELEDGEVTDGDDKRPEESEPKAVCRFFTRGQCTWGMSCRFLHPGTTDKGNYTMFDMVRPIPVPQAAPIIPPAYDYRNDRPPIHHMPPHAAYGHPRVPPVVDSESAWERGLRTAKEMMRKANKRKEQDIDFDEKKMNLSGPPDEIEKDPYYVRGSPEPTPPFERIPRERPRFEYSPPSKYSRGAPAPFEEDLFGRVPRYRELPAHRMPHYEDDDLGKRRMVRATREVIVEKADEWSDPWARKSRRGSAGRERVRGRERSYSSNSSYSSTSGTSRSHSSSESSGSPSAPRRKRFEKPRSKERTTPRKPVRAKSRSLSQKRRHSPPVPVRPRTIEKKLASPIPSLKRKKPISPARAERKASHKKKRDNSTSGSASSSGSESDSSYSSSTSDSKGKKKREKIVVERKPSAKVEMTKKRATPVKDDKKDKISAEKAAAAAKMKSTRREELLKQLKAVEDAIARKKSKI